MTKRLIIHIGYPKTATTTLQVGVLRKLHDEGAINYLGNSELSDDADGKLVDQFLRQVFFRKGSGNGLYAALAGDRPFLDGLLSSEMPNVLSYEYFTIPGFGDFSQKDVPDMIRTAFGRRDVEYTVLLTTRSQPSLIDSFYAHFFEWAHLYADVARIDTRVCDVDRWVSEEVLAPGSLIRNSFDFADVTRSWAKVFGEKNIRVTLFEDLAENPDRYFQPWAKSCGLPLERFLELHRASTSMRVRGKTSKGYRITIPRAFRLRMRLRKKASRNGGRMPLKDKVLLYILRELPYRKLEVRPLSDDLRQRIVSIYAASNEKFLARHGLDEPELRKYGYVA